MISKHYIYKTTNLLNNRYYIGKRSERYLTSGYLGSGVALKHAIKKYGRDNFKKDILEFNESKEVNAQREIEILGDLWKTDPLCYNMQHGGIGGGHAQTEESKIKISLKNTGKKRSDETKQKMSDKAKQRVISDETRQKLSQSLKGRIMTSEHKRKLSEARQRTLNEKRL